MRIAALVFAASALCALPAQSQISASRRPVFHKGFSYASWTADGYDSDTSDAQLAALKEGGVEWGAIVTHWLQASRSATELAPHPRWTPTDASLLRAIRHAHRLGMKVFLKPQVDFDGPGWRGEIAHESERAWKDWFASYRRFIGHYARLAARERVAMLCVGVELDGTRHREAEWRETIRQVRSLYRGPLTYATNWNSELDITWWDALDYVGVDAYYPLVERPGCTVEELKTAWNRHRDRLRQLHRKTGRPILFTEIGYRSTDQAAILPWEWEKPAAVSLEEQARLYQATLETFWDEPWFAGAFWWLWEVKPPDDPRRDSGYTPQGKPAWDVLRAYYARPRAAPGPAR